MKNKLLIFSLLLLPVCLFISARALKEVQGPYFLNFYDPSYVYLINSLNLSELSGYGIGHFDHPGTTVQAAGAVILKIYSIFSKSDSGLSRDVLQNPEKYLSVINTTLIVINCITLFLIGLFIFKITDNIILSVLFQLSPFVSAEIFYGLIIVTPENFLVFVSLIMIGLLIYYLYRIDPGQSTPLWYVIISGIICGFGLVTKLNFVPVVIIPFLIINKFKLKIIFLITLLLSFFIFFSPAISNFTGFLSWLKNLFINSGQYGTGEPNIINSSQFFKNILLIFSKDKLFFFTFLICLVSIIFPGLLKQNYSGSFSLLKTKKILFLIFICFNVQIILVAKHYAQYYLIPSFMLCTLTLALSSVIWFEHFKKYFPGLKLNQIFISLILIISVYGAYKIISSYYEGEVQRTEAVKISDFVKKNYPEDFVICAFGSADPDCARAFASQYAADRSAAYKNILKEIQRRDVFYNPWVKSLFTVSAGSEMKDKIEKNKKIILQMNNYGSIIDFVKVLENNYGKKVISTEVKFTNGNGESVYEIRFQ